MATNMVSLVITWLLLVKICYCSTNTLVAFKSQFFGCYDTDALLVIYPWSTHSRNLLLRNNQLGIIAFVRSRS